MWEEALSESFEESVLLVGENRLSEARDEFSAGFSENARIISDAAGTNPPSNFANYGGWPDWVKQLSDKTSSVQQALQANDPSRVKQELWKLREHFYVLHEQTKTLRTCDVLFAYVRELSKPQPSAETLLKLNSEFELAEYATKATSKAVEFTQAKNDLTKAVRNLTKDNAISAEDRSCLLKYVSTFYTNFGIQLH